MFNKSITRIWSFISSSRLALILVGLLILISIFGAILPQEGLFNSEEIKIWQEDHGFLTGLLGPLGMFRAFHSIPFLILIILSHLISSIM